MGTFQCLTNVLKFQSATTLLYNTHITYATAAKHRSIKPITAGLRRSPKNPLVEPCTVHNLRGLKAIPCSGICHPVATICNTFFVYCN